MNFKNEVTNIFLLFAVNAHAGMDPDNELLFKNLHPWKMLVKNLHLSVTKRVSSEYCTYTVSYRGSLPIESGTWPSKKLKLKSL